MKTKCYTWLKDTDKGRKFSTDNPASANAKTGPLPILGAKGNLIPKRAQIVRDAASDRYWEAVESPRNGDDWIVDSGATRHITYDRKAFIEYLADNLRSVETASGAVLAGASYGKVRLLVCVKGRTRSIVLTDVLHVPQIRGNLISIARLQDKGIVVETTAPPAKNALVIKD